MYQVMRNLIAYVHDHAKPILLLPFTRVPYKILPLDHCLGL